MPHRGGARERRVERRQARDAARELRATVRAVRRSDLGSDPLTPAAVQELVPDVRSRDVAGDSLTQDPDAFFPRLAGSATSATMAVMLSGPPSKFAKSTRVCAASSGGSAASTIPIN